METRRKIVIAEDHTILRAGLRALLSGQNGLEVIGEAGDGREAIRKVDTLQPDLLLIDLSMPKLNGIDAIREIKSQHPEIKIIVLTVHKSEEYIIAALQAGANGYMLKDASQNELLLAIDYVINGKTFLSPSISDKVVDAFLNTDKKDKPAANLTAREREILKLVAEGNTNKKIAEHLCISLKTVEKHRSNLMQKLDLRNTAALTAYAIAKKMVDF
jgi:two-component system, NarL family, response regulator NreC